MKAKKFERKNKKSLNNQKVCRHKINSKTLQFIHYY